MFKLAYLCILFSASFSSVTIEGGGGCTFLELGSWLYGTLFSSLTVSVVEGPVLSKLLRGTYLRALALYISRLFLRVMCYVESEFRVNFFELPS
jgi:hypothetical protein